MFRVRALLLLGPAFALITLAAELGRKTKASSDVWSLLWFPVSAAALRDVGRLTEWAIERVESPLTRSVFTRRHYNSRADVRRMHTLGGPINLGHGSE